MKLGLIILLMLVPIVSLLYFFFSARQEAITFARRELLGIDYLMPFKNLLEHLPQHRDLMAGYLLGGARDRERLLNLQLLLDADFKALDAVDQQLGTTLDTTERLRAVSRRWSDLQQRVTDLKPEQSFEQHTKLMAEVTTLIQHVADQSNLTLDPHLDSFYLTGTVVNNIPALIESLSILRGIGNSIAVRKARPMEEQVQLRLVLDQVRRHLDALQRGLQVVYKQNAGLERLLMPVVAAALDGIESFTKTTSQRIVYTETITIAPLDYFAAGTEAIGRLTALYDQALGQVKALIDTRLQQYTVNRNWQLVIALGLTILAIAVAMSVHRLITRQIAAIGDLFSHIGLGNYAARAVVLSRDELGTMAISLNTMLDNTLNLIQSQEERDALQASIVKLLDEVSTVAEGDLTAEAEVTADATGAIADAFNYMIHQLRMIITQVQEATLQVSSSANELQTTAEHLAHGTTSQAEQIVESSAALDEMAVSVQQVSESASLSSTVAEQALDNAKRGTSAVRNTVQAMQRMRTQAQETAKRMKRLGERSQKIGEIVQLIGDIADRTSILALNASIQAARAGEAGRAFTVVAEEVERLAERAANATRQISSLVHTIQSETNEAILAMEENTREVVQGSQLADQAGQALGEIESVSTRLAELIQSISLAASQQARGSDNLSKAMGEISEVTQQTAAGTKQAALSIGNLAALADDLRASVSAFKLPVSTNGHNPTMPYR